jgi:hypothetical protein
MSNWMGIVLERGPLPNDVVPEGVAGFGNGQGILGSVDELSDICEHFGLTRLDTFIVDRNALEAEALEAAGWVDVPPKNWIPLQDDLGDVEYVAAQREHWRIVQEMEAKFPWFDPSDGLRTVRGLMRLIEAGIPHASREELREKRVREHIERGIEPRIAETLEHQPRPAFPLTSCLWNLRTFELELAYAERENDRFNFAISY